MSAPIMLVRYRKPGARILAFAPPPTTPAGADAGGAVIRVLMQAVRTSNTW